MLCFSWLESLPKIPSEKEGGHRDRGRESETTQKHAEVGKCVHWSRQVAAMFVFSALQGLQFELEKECELVSESTPEPD